MKGKKQTNIIDIFYFFLLLIYVILAYDYASSEARTVHIIIVLFCVSTLGPLKLLYGLSITDQKRYKKHMV
jgi:hypothetical protein